ncbi:hypothetical protein GJ700_17760 [Duganella sp. FT92W]|uniref:Uncharacterized protein n=1 Tax=Pseudoduganella rivuli TaxID=2666085 RepID=A0A7X2LV02_9BURK|nr:hypothetical protein [Pseudoduganella rivuli]MRV73562.1 hypothetical protein [Pseudoduganella rivuli]
MPKAIAKKLKEMKDPNYLSGREDVGESFDEFRKRFLPPEDDSNEPVKIMVRFSSMESHLQKKLLSLMQSILDIGRAAEKIYEQGESIAFKTYFCAILSPTDLVQTLSSFQFVYYSDQEVPIGASLFWPGSGTVLSETHFTATGTINHCLHNDMETVSEAWEELTKLIRISLSTWTDESVQGQHDAKTSQDYCLWRADYSKEINVLNSKIDHVIAAMPQIAEKINAWADARRELFIERQNYEDNMYATSEDFDYP